MTSSESQSGEEYLPPQSGAIADSQNSIEALRLLVAQRKLYKVAKRWAFLRTVGLSVVAVAAPIITAFYPVASVAVGAVAGVWIFLSRTVFIGFERRRAAAGAAVQEQFDLLVYKMPEIALRDPQVTPEEVSRLTGDDEAVMRAAKAEQLYDWYPVDRALDGDVGIAIMQRANAAYAERLHNSNANVWLAVAVGWSVVAVSISLYLGLGLGTFLLGVALPVLPALLDVVEQWRNTKQAGEERRAMASGIERLIRGQDTHVLSGQDLLVWQGQLYNLRREAPQIPSLIYKRTRRKNELAMNSAAAELSRVAKNRKGSVITDREHGS